MEKPRRAPGLQTLSCSLSGLFQGLLDVLRANLGALSCNRTDDQIEVSFGLQSSTGQQLRFQIVQSLDHEIIVRVDY